MWLFIPSNCVPASECSEKASEPHSAILESSIELSVSWSAKPVQRANLLRLWKREPSIRRLSGITLQPSTAQCGVDAWIASLPVSLAKTCPLRADEQDSTASARVSSSMSPTLQMLAVRVSSFWRTSQASLLPPPPLWTKPKASSTNARPPESWENWPTAGGIRNGCIFARPTSVQLTSVSDGFASHGAWLTPNVPNGGRSVSAEVVASRGMTENGKRTVGLESEVKHWATPDANAMERTNRSDSPNAATRPTLALAAAQWATPTSSENSNRTTKMAPTHGNGHGIVLAGQAADMTNSLRPVLSTIDGRELSPNTLGSRPRLNPLFVEWLMGWPIGWTEM